MKVLSTCIQILTKASVVTSIVEELSTRHGYWYGAAWRKVGCFITRLI